MRVDATGTEAYTDFEPYAAGPEMPAPLRAAQIAANETDVNAARREAILDETSRAIGNANIKPGVRALAEKVIDRLRDGSVDDTSVLMIAKGLQSLGRTRAEMPGIDCSGFVKRLAKEADAPIDHLIIPIPDKNGCTQMKASFVPVDAAKVKTGDLVFFNDRTNPEKTASHVGIVIVAQDGEKLFLNMTNHGVDINRMTDVASRETKARWGSQVCGYAKNPALRVDA